MTNNNTEDDFLNKLYKQSALEKPPADLDQQILELAKASHQRTRFAMTMNLQRVLSVAAVMVLSVYIFFEVGSDRPMSMEEDFIYHDKSLLRSSPVDPQTERLDMSDEVHAKKQVKNKEAKKSVERVMEDYEADDISEISAKAREQSGIGISESSSELSSAPALMRQMSKTEQTLETAKAEDMLKEIEQLLASEKLEQAKLVYRQFKLLFPDYPVPVLISDAIVK